MAPLHMANPVTDTPIVTEENRAYAGHTSQHHAEIAADDEEYICMKNTDTPTQLHPSIGKFSVCVLVNHNFCRFILTPYNYSCSN